MLFSLGIRALLLVPALFFALGLPARATAAGQPVVLCLLFPQSGVPAAGNHRVLLGVQLALRSIAAEGGLLGQQIKLYMIDTADTPLGARKAAKRAVSLDATAVIGPAVSSQCIAAAPVLQQHRVPMITPSGTAPEITRIGDCIFRACLNNEHIATAAADYIANHLGVRNAAMLTDIDELYSRDMSGRFQKHFSAVGGAIAATQPYRARDMDFTTQLTALRDIAPGAVFVPGYAKNIGLILRQADKMGLRTPFVGGAGIGSLAGKYKGVQSLHMITGIFWNRETVEGKRFRRRFESRYPDERLDTFLPALGYDAVMLLARAVQHAGSTDREKVRSALASVPPYKGASGDIHFDANGDRMRSEVHAYTLNNDTWRPGPLLLSGSE